MSEPLDRVMTDRARRAVTAVAWLSLLGTVAAWLYGASMVEPPNRDVDSYGSGPIGHRAWVELLETLELTATRHRTAYRDLSEAPVLFLEPARSEVTVDGWSTSLRDVLEARDEELLETLVVLPKWRMKGGEAVLVPKEEVANILRIATGNDQALVQRQTDGSTEAQVHATHGALGDLEIEVPELQTMSVTTCESLVQSDAGSIAALCGTTIVLSDPDLLHNFNLHRRDNATLTIALIREGLAAESVVVDELFHGHGVGTGLGAALSKFPTVLVPVHLLLLGTLIVLAGMRRFGSQRQPPAAFERGPRRIIHVAAGVLASGANPSRLVVDYIRHLLRDTADLLRSEQEEDPHRAASKLDQIALRLGVEPVAEMSLAGAEEASVESRRKALGPSLRAAQRVWRLRQHLRKGLAGK